MRLLVVVYFVLHLKDVQNLTAPKSKSPKPINWNSSYYSEKFQRCKTMRVLNPVEKMRAQGFAVDAFRRCGVKAILYFGQKYSVPAFALYEAAEVSCFIMTILMAYGANDGSVIIERNTPPRVIMDSLRDFCEGLRRGQFQKKIVDGKRSFVIDGAMYADFYVGITACILRGNVTPFTDGDYLKHIISHARAMIL